MKYSVDPKDINKLVKQIEKDSDDALMKCWLYLEGKIRDEMQRDSYDTWKLAESINTQRVSENKIVVWTNLEYALVREYGRRPWKFPPLQALVWWTARKGMITWWVTSRYEDLHYTDKGVVFLIARAIAVNWTQGKHTFEKVVKREEKNIIHLYAELMSKW